MMNRRLQRHHADNMSSSEYWVNSDHVVAIYPNASNPKLSYVETIRDTVAVVGTARDVALELNGHFDE